MQEKPAQRPTASEREKSVIGSINQMGCSAFYFSDRVQSWLWLGWLKSGNLFLDFGAQDFNADDADTRRELRAFLRKQQVSQYTIDAAARRSQVTTSLKPSVRYTAVDVDARMVPSSSISALPAAGFLAQHR